MQNSERPRWPARYVTYTCAVLSIVSVSIGRYRPDAINISRHRCFIGGIDHVVGRRIHKYTCLRPRASEHDCIGYPRVRADVPFLRNRHDLLSYNTSVSSRSCHPSLSANAPEPNTMTSSFRPTLELCQWHRSGLLGEIRTSATGLSSLGAAPTERSWRN